MWCYNITPYFLCCPSHVDDLKQKETQQQTGKFRKQASKIRRIKKLPMLSPFVNEQPEAYI